MEKYNDWQVINNNFIYKKGKKFLLCECKCGRKREIYFYALTAGASKRCHSCASKNKELPQEFKDSWKGKLIGALNATMYSHIKSKATERKLEFKVSQKYLADLFDKQNRKCALSGLDITLSTKIKNGNSDFNFITASVDRINSSLGYTEDNVQWVHKDINKMKMAYANDYFIYICKLIAQNNGNIEPL